MDGRLMADGSAFSQFVLTIPRLATGVTVTSSFNEGQYSLLRKRQQPYVRRTEIHVH